MHSLSLLLSLLPLPSAQSLPAPNLGPFSGPPLAGNTGIDTGISMTMYTKPKCDKSSNVQTVELQYNHQIAQQFRSYSLNGTFSDDQKVSIFAPKDWKAEGFDALDAAAVGNVGLGCEQFVYDLEDNMLTEGCHSFNTMMGCVEVTVV